MPSCRGPCGRPESLNHLLQGCSLTHGPRVKRHDEVVRFLARRFRHRQHTTVYREPIIPTEHTFIKPDLVVVCAVVATIVDVAVTSDGQLRTADAEKRRKYGASASIEAIKNFLRPDHGDLTIKQLPFVLTWRGVLPPSAFTSFRPLGLTRRDLHDIVWLVVRGSLATYNQYFRSTFLA